MKERPAAVLQRTKFEPESLATTRIGEWRIAPDLNQIARGAEIVRLEPKAMAVLLRLAGRPGEVVSRDELLAAVWPNVIVGDNALTQVVIKLRKALGDTVHEPRYIQAISKKGYRLIATVEYELQTPGQAAAEMPAQRLPPRPARVDADPPPTGRGIRSTRAVWAISATLVLTAAAGTGWWLWQGQAGDVASSAIEPSSVSGDALPLVSVEPFEAVGTEPRHELIARGITADLVTDLSKVSNLRVATGVEPPSTRAALRSQARYVLSGSVQGDHGRLRLHAHLADVVAGRQLWSQRFDRDSTVLFAVQDGLLRSILSVLPVKVSEAETLRLLEVFPIVPRFLELVEQGQMAYLVMEFIRGQDLLKLMEGNNNKPFPMDQVIAWGQQICDVLQYMHNQTPPLVHRDLKPDNVMLLEDQKTIKMIDFGTARDLGRTAKEKAAAKTRVYTEGYAPPEQIVGKPEPRSDLFLLAGTLYHLATGKAPEGFQTARELEDALASGNATLPASYRWFFELIRINLAEDVNERYFSAQEFKQDLAKRQVTTQVACPKCQQVNKVREPYCSKCAEPLTQPTPACYHCGKTNRMGSRCCIHCGNRLR